MDAPLVVRVEANGRWRLVDAYGVERRAAGEGGGAGAEQGAHDDDQDASLLEWCAELAHRRIVLPVPGQYGVVNRTVHLWEHVYEVTRAIRHQLNEAVALVSSVALAS